MKLFSYFQRRQPLKDRVIALEDALEQSEMRLSGYQIKQQLTARAIAQSTLLNTLLILLLCLAVAYLLLKKRKHILL